MSSPTFVTLAPALPVTKSCLPLCLVFIVCLIADARADTTYERDVRPILKTHCFHCHGEAGVKEAALDVRLRRFLIEGGDSGAAIVPGKPADSLLLTRIKDGEMPPEDVQQRLTTDEVARIETWIQEGAVTARDEPQNLDDGTYFTEEERSHWSFQPIVRTTPQSVEGDVTSTIDYFIADQLRERGIDIAELASKTTLLRRAYFDLIGLPPTIEQTQRFISNDSPDAYERLLDELLASPQYGERWGRHWLDVAGYADSEGYTETDPIRPYAYKYRDYVINSFNEDLSLDQFVVEQLAGDELVGRVLRDLTPEEVRLVTATGFLRTAPDGTGVGGVEQSIARNDVIAKTIEITTSSLMGVTVACAQCHDHRYDPITQQDYYRFRAIFEPALNWKTWLVPAKRRVSLYTDADKAKAAAIEVEAKKIDAERSKKLAEFIEATFNRELAKLDESLREPVRKARATDAKKRTAEQKKLLKSHPSVNVTASSLYLYDRKADKELKKLAKDAKDLRATKPKVEYIRALYESTKPPPPTFLFHRGDFEQPKQQLEPAALSVLADRTETKLPTNVETLPSSGRRLALAQWLTNRDHPLLSRVFANRLWLQHFGRGIVSTPADFGMLGTRPTHPQLLDWLALELMDGEWSAKRMQRVLMTSSTYRRSSLTTPTQLEKDRENRWLGRMPVRRIEAETLRDTLLAVSDQLNRRQGGAAVPVMADRVGQFVIGKENLNAGRPGAVIPMKGEEYRRSIYVQVRRSRPLSVMESFDLPRMEPNCKVRGSSTVAPQSLQMMNSTFVVQQAEAFAKWAEGRGGNRKQHIDVLWQATYARRPTADEATAAAEFLDGQVAEFLARLPKPKTGTNDDAAAHEALTSLSHALLSSNEFLYLD